MPPSDHNLLSSIRRLRFHARELAGIDLHRRALLGAAVATLAKVGAGSAMGEPPPEEKPRAPQAPDAASPRAKELIARMSLEVPPPIEVAHSISYRLSTRADADQRRLDIYRNMSSGRNPVVIFVHGGAWRSGHRRQYIPLGVCLALNRITAVIPNYSQAPGYRFPEPERDIAAVVNWVRDNMSKYGGDPNKIFLAGHSTGVQIAALVALNPRYLGFHSVPLSAIRGVIAISGIYDVPAGFEYAFGEDADRVQASPMRFVSDAAPPFLIVRGGNDAQLVLRQSEPFAKSLKAHGVEVEIEVYPEEDHSSIIALASIRESPLLERVVRFVKDHS